MARFFKKREQARGQSPGELIFIGEKKVDYIQCKRIDYNGTNINEMDIHDIKTLSSHPHGMISWININGLHDISAVKEIGNLFQIHPLVLEDIVNTGQRPKIEEFDTSIFIVMKMIRFDKESGMMVNEQLSIVIAENMVLTFQERPGDVFDPVRERIRRHKGRIRNSGSDYLAYALMDTVVDNYIHIVERLGEKIEELEDDILSNPDRSVMEKISSFKREINYLRKSIRPAREALAQIPKLENDLLKTVTVPFFKDLNDLITHVTEAIDTYRDLLTDQLSIYNSVTSNRMNDIMKILTMFSSIFIPLTFITGIYGTNFDYLPELNYRYSYFILWGVIIVIASSLILFFKRKGWF
ncbi:MAG: magnesium/cobalt transporter CorA [Desulfamplus sp.]|nr:magnesium/cobalt transporter CorA [Desulfamplus sp.]